MYLEFLNVVFENHLTDSCFLCVLKSKPASMRNVGFFEIEIDDVFSSSDKDVNCRVIFNCILQKQIQHFLKDFY